MSYNNELARHLYTTENIDESGNHQEQDEVTKVEQAVLNRRNYDWCEFRQTGTILLTYLCCCLKNVDCHRRAKAKAKASDAVLEGLSDQLDIIEMLRWFRIFKFVSIVTLRKN